MPCGRLGQEIVPFDGTVHGLFHFSTSASGRLHVKAQLNGRSMDVYEFDILALPYTYTYVNNFHVESAGATGNIIAHETLKLYFDQNGVPSVQTVNFVAECKNFAS